MIDDVVWQKLVSLYQNNPDIKCANASDKQIFDAQTEIGVMFSDFYRYFLKHHAVSLVGDWIIYTLNSPSVIEATKAFRNKVTANIAKFSKWYIVGNNSQNDLLAINEKGDIWTFPKGSITNRDRIAENFERFLGQVID